MTGYSQKGVGESEGMSRQRLNPEIVELNGTVKQVEVGPCKYTTGRSISGTHLMIEEDKGRVLNIHLGPTSEVSGFVTGIEGDAVKIIAFRTNKLPEGHYIAKELVNNGNKIILRDDTLRPFWAGRSGRENWGQRRRKNN